MNFAFIGCGDIAREHAKVLRSLGHKITLCNSKSKKSLRWKLFNKENKRTEYVEKIQNILNDKNVDFVIVCTSWDKTEQILPKLLSSDKTMLIEKPISFKYEFLKNLSKNNLNCKNKFVGFNRRFYNTVQKLSKRLLKKDLIYADVKITENYDQIIKKYGNKIKNKIHHVTATTHIIDLTLFLFGKLIVKNLKVIKSKKNNCKSVFANCVNKNNTFINISIFNQNPSKTGITCYFKDGTTWDLSPIEVLSVYDKYNITYNKKNKLSLYQPNLLKKFYEKDKEYKLGFFNQMKSIIRKNTNHTSTIQDNLKLIQLFDKLKK